MAQKCKYISKFSRSKYILHHFIVDKNEDDIGINYYIIIRKDLMGHIGLKENLDKNVRMV